MLKDLLGGLVTAFSMYSIIPMPHMEWKKDTMKYAMCFFPLVGLLIGAVIWGWLWLSGRLGLHVMLFGAGVVLLPVILSGAIHLDGLLDTADALGSHQDREKKLEILKDSHVGAFGVITCAGYLLASYGMAAQLGANPRLLGILCLGYLVSRACSSAAMMWFPTAKNSGLAHLFADNAQKGAVKAAAVVYLVIGGVGMLLLSPLVGGITVLLIGGWFWYFHHMCMKQFGGLTGDLAGYSLCAIEFICLSAAALGGTLCAW